MRNGKISYAGVWRLQLFIRSLSSGAFVNAGSEIRVGEIVLVQKNQNKSD